MAAQLAPSPAPASGTAGASSASEALPLGPEEERRALLEHALASLEVEVSQRGELLADLGELRSLLGRGVWEHAAGWRSGSVAAGCLSAWEVRLSGRSMPAGRPHQIPPAPAALPTVAAGAPDGYGPTGLTELQLEELLGAVTAHMDAACGADVTVLRRRKVGGWVGMGVGEGSGWVDGWVGCVAQGESKGVVGGWLVGACCCFQACCRRQCAHVKSRSAAYC